MLKIDLYSDIVCPWCILGQHRLDKVLLERFQGLDVDIEHHPYELHPGAPPNGFRLDEYFRQKGNPDMSVAAARLEGEARASGLDLNLSQQPYVYRTIHAHTLLRHARDRGTQHDLSMAFMKAYFSNCRNISDKEVLSAIAAKHGFRTEEVRSILANPREQAESEKQVASSKAAGVRFVPTFNMSGVVAGGGSEDQIATAIAQAVH